MAQPLLSPQVGLELLASEPPDVLVLSFAGLARVETLLPRHVYLFLKAQLEVFEVEVMAFVMQADSVVEARQRLESRSSLVEAMNGSTRRALLGSLQRSEVLQNELVSLPLALAAALRPTTLRWLRRKPALTLEGALERTAATSEQYRMFLRDVVRSMPSNAILASVLGEARYEPLSALKLAAQGLSMCVVMAAERESKQAQQSHAPAMVSELVDELWRAVHRHQRAMTEWMQACALARLRELREPLASRVSTVLVSLEPALEPRSRFLDLCQEWHAATGHLSNPSQIIAHPAYGAIIEMGWEVVPFILEAIEKEEPDLWGNALHRLTGEEPPLPEGDTGTMDGIGEAWLTLARQRGWPIGGGRAG